MSTYATNKQARYDYDILDTIEAGLVLTGAEVKSVRQGGMNLKGAFVTFHKGEPHLTNAHIRNYPYASNTAIMDPDRSRKLLLNKNEINRLLGKSAEKGLTIIPLSVYTKGRRVKVEIGIAKGKKQYDKRRSIKEKEQEREVGREMKRS